MNRSLRSGLWILLICFPIFLFSICTADSEKVFGLPKTETLYTDPEEALEHGRPVRIEREARYLTRWRSWLLAEHRHYYEGGDTVVSLRKPTGEAVVTYPPMSGPIIISESQRRILDCGISAHTMVDFAVVYDDVGREIRRIPKVVYTRNCGKTDDDLLFWLHYNVVEEGAALNVISVHRSRRILRSRNEECWRRNSLVQIQGPFI